MRYAQILHDKAHWIFESEETLAQLYERFTSDMVFVDITNLTEVREGWQYDGEAFINPHEVSFDELKEHKRIWVNLERERREQGGFLFAGKIFDSDKGSVQRLNIAAQNALVAKVAGVPYGINWTLADNAKDTLDADGMLGVAKALAEHCSAVHAIAQQLKQAIEDADTVEELDSLAWPE